MLAKLDHRVELLSEALELSRTLSKRLDQLGANRVLRPDEGKRAAHTAYQLVEILEDDLSLDMQRLRVQRNAVVPAISRIPEDLLRNIFLLGHLRNTADWKFPVTISHVCTAWRNICISTAQLWATVVIDDLPAVKAETFLIASEPLALPWHPAFPYGRSDRPPVFLSRSRGALLDLSLSVVRHQPDPNILSTYASRISSLALDIENIFSCGDLLIGCISAMAPTLRSLSLRSRMPMSFVSEKWPMLRRLYTKSLPLLREVTFDSWPLLEQYDQSFIFLAACRTLKLLREPPCTGEIRRAELVTTLRCCPQVEEIHLRAPCVASSPAEPRLVLPHTKRLVVSPSSCSCLSSLSVPNLKALEVDNMARSVFGGPTSGTIQQFLQASSARLDEFRLRGLNSSDRQHVFELLSQLDSIHSLTITYFRPEEADACLTLLDFSTKERRVCPNLTRLSYGTRPSRDILRRLRDVAASRKLSPNPLRTIILHGWDAAIKAQYDPERTDGPEQELAAEIDMLVIGDWWYDREQVTWKSWVT